MQCARLHRKDTTISSLLCTNSLSRPLNPWTHVRSLSSSSCRVLCATHCCEIRQRGGVSLSASRVAARRAAPSEDLRRAERARLVIWFYQQTVKKKCFISKPFPTRRRVALERQVSVNRRVGESASQDAICLSEKVAAPPSLRSSGCFWRSSNVWKALRHDQGGHF